MAEDPDPSIDSKVDRVEEIIEKLEDSDVEMSLTEAQDLKNEAKNLIDEVEDKLALNEGELEQVNPE